MWVLFFIYNKTVSIRLDSAAEVKAPIANVPLPPKLINL